MRDLRKGIVALMALTVAAAGTLASTGLVAAQDGPVIGVSWNNYNEERWLNSDEPAIKAAVEAAGGTYISTDAKSDANAQLADVENLITQGANALIILAQDKDAILPAVQAAADAGIPVIAYDRIIEDPSVLYMTFDNVGVGRAMAEVIFGLVPARQLRRHQGQRGGREHALPEVRHGRGHRRRLGARRSR